MDGINTRVALVWRGDARARARGGAEQGRFAPLFAELTAAGLAPEPCVYDEMLEAEVAAQLTGCAAALVWVNPLQGGVLRRDGLDALLRWVAAAGVKVSAHPHVIETLGVKSVLWRTRELGWSGDARFYGEPHELARGLAASLTRGPRVLKQNRGNDGVGVWKVEFLEDGLVRVQEAARDAQAAVLRLDDFVMERLASFKAAGGYVDQAWQPRLPEGMIRCYMSAGRLVGFGHHLVRALAPPEAGPGGPRLYSGPDDPRFRGLRRRMETEWTPGLQDILGLPDDALPAIWDADFLLGPPDADGQDTYVLCEINVSSVYPYPDEAPAAIARTLAARLAARPRTAAPQP